MGDFVSGRILDHEGRGAGKSTTPGGREKNAFFSKEESYEKKLLRKRVSSD
jgi:hypothetical protein